MGFCSHAVCDTHEGIPITPDEVDEFEQDNEPCIHAVRLHFNPSERQQTATEGTRAGTFMWDDADG